MYGQAVAASSDGGKRCSSQRAICSFVFGVAMEPGTRVVITVPGKMRGGKAVTKRVRCRGRTVPRSMPLRVVTGLIAYERRLWLIASLS